MRMYTLQVRCWYCRAIFPLTAEVSSADSKGRLLDTVCECPECQEECQVTIRQKKLGEISLAADGSVPLGLEDIPDNVLEKHVFGGKQAI